MHFHRLLGAALAALLILGVQQVEAANSPLTQKRGTITTQNLVPAGACTTGGCVESEITTAGSVTVQVTGTYTASGGLSAQATTDGSTWVTLCSSTCSTTFTRATTGATSATIASGVQDVFQVPATGYKRLRITALGAVTGTASITIQPTELVPSGFASISGGAGDASAANQVTGNASLASIDTKTPALGQALAAASVPVILPSATITTLTPPATIAVAQGSTTSGQTGPIIQGAVTTSAPTYTNAQTSPLSLDTSGNLRVNVVTGGAGGGNVTGGTAHDAVGTSVNPVLVGGYASAAAPTDVSADGDVVREWRLRNGAAATQPTYAGVLAVAGNGASGTGVQRVTIANDSTPIGALTETAPASDTASSGLNGRLQRIAQNLTTLNTSVNTASNYEAQKDAAVPTRLVAMGARIGANADAVAQGAATVAINVSSATTTQIVGLSGSTKIYVTGLTVIAGGTGNITLVYGTGTNCGTGTTSLSGAMPLVANSGLSIGGGLGAVLMVPAGQALCVTTSAAVQYSGFVTYAQF